MRPTVKLGEILKFIRNGKSCKQNKERIGDRITRIETISDGTINENKVGFFELSEDDKEKYIIKKGDILFSHINSVEHIGKIAIAEKDYDNLYHGMNLLLLRCDQTRIYPKFLFVVLNNYFIKGYWENVCQKAINQASLNQGKIVDIEIPLPPLETQKAIVAKLDQIFAELDQTKSEIQKNLDNTDELWKSALNQAFQGDWEMKTIEELTTSIEYGIGETGLDKGDLRYVRITDIDEDCLLKDYDKKYIMLNEKSKLSLLKKGDVLIARTGATFGKCLYFDSDEQSAFAGYLIRPNFKKEVNTKYFSLFAQSGLYWNQANNLVSGGGQPQFNANAIKKIKFIVPPLSEQEKIVVHLDQVSKEVKALKSQYQSQLDNLEELKKSVLDKAFRGEMG